MNCSVEVGYSKRNLWQILTTFSASTIFSLLRNAYECKNHIMHYNIYQAESNSITNT